MSKPLTGRIVANPSGTFTASVPTARGAKARRPETFNTKTAAEHWRRKCVAALESGMPLPDPDPAQLSRSANSTSAARTGTSFKTLAEAWVQERYIEDRHGNIDRENQIRGYVDVIDTYLQTQDLRVEDITRLHARAMYKHLLKDTSQAREVEVSGDENPEALVTRTEAIELLASHGYSVSDSTFKRALKRPGGLQPKGTRGPAHVYRVDDIFSRDAGLAVPPTTGRYAHSTMTDVRRTFRAVLDYAESDGVLLQPQVRNAELPRDTTPESKTRALTLAETARVAARLHVVHQLVLLLLRLLGLRISESFGLLVEDVIDCGKGEPGLITVQSQGGRKFRRRQADGSVATTDHVDETKRDSWRVLVVPTPLMDLVRIVIDVFHTDQDGVVRADARLIPGLQRDDAGGQSTFRNALGSAAAAEGLDIVMDVGRAPRAGAQPRVTPTPQMLRRSFATALQASRATIENIRAVLGHRRGADVIHEHYLLEDVELKPQRDIADELARQIASELPSGLMVPTAKSCTTRRQPALFGRAAEIDAGLLETGWLVPVAPDARWVTVADAAGLRSVTPTQIRDDVAKGRVRSMVVERPDQDGSQYLVDVADVLEMSERVAPGSDMRQLAEELDVAYDKVRQYIRRHPDLAVEDPAGRDYRLSDDVADQVRSYFQDQRALAERALRMPDVAARLGVSVAAVKTLVRHGRLVEDARFHGGVQSVTRASLDVYQRTGRRRRPRTRASWSPSAMETSGNDDA